MIPRPARPGPATLTLVLMASAVFSSPVTADGKFFGPDAVPPGEPFQRAVLVHADGREFLFIQPQLVGAAKEFAWVLPVPAAPDAGHMDGRMAEGLFFLDLAIGTRLQVHQWRYGFFLGLIVLASLFTVLPWPRRPPRSVRGALFLALLPIAFFSSMAARPRGIPADDGVEVLYAEQAGIYDLQVVRPEKPGAMKAWLEGNGFRLGADDGPALRSYEEHGWCFVTARISSAEARMQSGMLDALALSFPSPEPVYPFALTAAGGAETEVLLFAYADHKLAHQSLAVSFASSLTEGDHARELAKMLLQGDVSWALPAGGKPGLPRVPGFLTKLRGRLSRMKHLGGHRPRPRARRCAISGNLGLVTPAGGETTPSLPWHASFPKPSSGSASTGPWLAVMLCYCIYDKNYP